MIRLKGREQWFFDAEWVPDPVTGRRTYFMDADASDDAVRERMWAEGGATEEDPRPYLKTVLCRVVSIATVIRRGPGDVILHALPRVGDEAMAERELIERFLGAIGDSKPQLVGFNISGADLPILLQRGAARGAVVPTFCERPDKPWEGIDYFARFSDWAIDLKDAFGGWGRTTPSLHELASACGVPGKIDTSGDDVLRLWEAGDVDSIVQYNLFDAVTTYLVWLRVARFAGLVEVGAADAEEAALREQLEGRVRDGEAFWTRYLERWDAVRG